MIEQIENLCRAMVTLLALVLWVPIVLVWIFFAPLFAILDILSMTRSIIEYRALRWQWCGVRLQANFGHADAGGKVAP